jgi:hypothetical protein
MKRWSTSQLLGKYKSKLQWGTPNMQWKGYYKNKTENKEYWQGYGEIGNLYSC